MSRWVRSVGVIALAVAVIALFLMRLNTAAGLMVDDAYYILLAKALAEGNGYRVVSSGTTPILPLYPPGFPLLLSLLFQIDPRFPENVWLLKSLSIAAMVTVGFLTYVYLRKRLVEADLSLIAAVAVTTIPAFVFLATSTVMSECVFTLAQLGAVLCLQRGAQHETSNARFLTAAAVFGSSAMLIRSAGISVLVAGVLWLVKERRWKGAATFGVVAAVCLLPWMTYARLHAPSDEERYRHGGSIAYSYTEQLRMRWAGTPGSGTISARDVPDRIATNVVDVFGRAFGGMFVPSMFRGPEESGEEVVSLGGRVGIGQGSMGSAPLTMALSTVLGGIVLIGFIRSATHGGVTVAEFLVPISVAIILLWPFWSFRFLLPLAPYLFFYLIAGIDALQSAIRVGARGHGFGSPPVARVALLVFLGLNLSDHARYLLAATAATTATERRPWLTQAAETNDTLSWIDQNIEGGIVATTNPALVSLRTGLKTVAFEGSVDDLRARLGPRAQVIASFVRVQMPAGPGVHARYVSPNGLWVATIENGGN